MTTPSAPDRDVYRTEEEWRRANPLRRWRLGHKPPVSQAAIAEALDVHETTIRYWENGRRFPDGDNMARLREKTEVPDLPSQWLTWREAGKKLGIHWL